MEHLNRREVLRLAALAASAFATEARGAGRDTLTAETSPPRGPALRASRFSELPVSSVKPKGWLLTQLQAQADGITGNLHHLYAPFTGDAWFSQQTDPATEWVPWEVRAYWCDGALRCGLLLQNQSLIDDASQLVKYTFDHPASDGFLGPAFLKAPGDYRRCPHSPAICRS